MACSSRSALLFAKMARLGHSSSFRRAARRVTRTLSSNGFASESNPSSDDSSLELPMTLEQRMDADLEKAATPFLQLKIKTHYQSISRLAKMMNRDPDTFTDHDMEEAIKYLLPTRLFARDARPLIKHPFEVYHSHMAESDDFTEDGKPKAAAFFTGAPKYFDTLYSIYEQEELMKQLMKDQNLDGDNSVHLSCTDANTGEELTNNDVEDMDANTGEELTNNDDVEDTDANTGEELTNNDDVEDTDATDGAADDSDEQSQYVTAMNQQHGPSRWLKKDEMSLKLATQLSDSQYDVIIGRLQAMLDMPYVTATEDFLMQFRKKIAPTVHYGKEHKLDASGRAYSTGHRKCSVAQVWLREGSGIVKVNRCLLFNYFPKINDRQQVMYPFLVTDTVGNFDVTCSVSGGGTTGQAGAIRYGISKALTCFSDTYSPLLEQAGLLTRDPRMVERKKPGQKKARKKFQWVKR